METPNDIPEMARQLAEFERKHWDSLPERVRQVIDGNRGGSVVDLFARTAEALYAHRDELTNKASKELAAKLASFSGAMGWHGWRGGRGLAASKAMLREAGAAPPQGQSWPKREEDPEPDSIYAPEPRRAPEA